MNELKQVTQRTKDFVVFVVSALLSIVLTKKVVSRFPYASGAVKLFVGFVAVSYRNEILNIFKNIASKITGRQYELHTSSVTSI